MKPLPSITEITVVNVKPNNSGLIAFASFIIDERFYVGSVAIFSRPDGSIRLAYPKKNGVNCFHPISREVGNRITNLIEQHLNPLMNSYEQNPADTSF